MQILNNEAEGDSCESSVQILGSVRLPCAACQVENVFGL